jgi:hypothetical protein
MATSAQVSRTDEHMEVTTVSDELTVLQDEFPAYQIWQEQLPGRTRYIARRLNEGLGPHTVVTADVGELRQALAQAGQAVVAKAHHEPAP